MMIRVVHLMLPILTMAAAMVNATEASDTAPVPAVLLSMLTRMFHFRPSGLGALCSQWLKCNPDLTCSYFHGEPLHGIGVCKRDVPAGHQCGNRIFACTNGTKCVQWLGGRRCRVSKPLGGECSDSQSTICDYGLACFKGKCVVDAGYGQKCGERRKCRRGLLCAGDHGHKVCKLVLNKGQRCGFPNGICAEDTECVKFENSGNRCVSVVDENEKCGAEFTTCNTGLNCIGSGEQAKCFGGGDKGEECGSAAYCKNGLECTKFGDKNRCVKVMAEGGDCAGIFMTCESGTTCLGPQHAKKCVRKPVLGSKCDNRYLICPSGSRCYHGKCVNLLRRGGDCGKAHHICYPGIKCVEEEGGKKTCYRPVPNGYFCQHPRLKYVTCTEGNVCKGKGVSARCFSEMEEGASCEGHYISCKAGLKCVGDRGQRKCRKVGFKGSPCHGTYGLCDKGLICVADNARSGYCYGISGKGEACGTEHMICGPHLYCAGSDNHKKCETRAKFGQKCEGSPHYGECEEGFECLGEEGHRTCHKVVGERYACGNPHISCSKSTICAGPDGLKECVKPMKDGGLCTDPFWVCEEGLECADVDGTRKCRLPAVKLGGDCSDEIKTCESGLKCVKYNGEELCRKPVRAGFKCKDTKQPFVVCIPPLVCKGTDEHAICSIIEGEPVLVEPMVKPLGNVGDKCDEHHYKCKASLMCGGPQGQTKCVKTRGKGYGCDNKYRLCEAGLSCITWGNTQRCVDIVDRNEDCGKRFTLCKLGLKCTKTQYGRKCY